MPKIVYVLTNPAMPNIVKIGVTTRNGVERRIQELSKATGIPLPFQCHYAGEVSDHGENVEKLIHQLFAKYRLPSGKEFFSIEPEEAVLALRLARAKNVTPQRDVTPEFEKKPGPVQERTIALVERRKRSRTLFSKLGIRPGSELTFSRDHRVRCRVMADNKVNFRGQLMSPSAAAVRALHRLGYKTKAASGTHYWLYKGKTIGRIRREREGA